MSVLVVLRHGPTDWSAEGRIQGRADRPLSDLGRSQVAQWQPPEAWAAWDWSSSPLARARQTAAVLCGRPVPVDDRLAEADWGDWEGQRLADIRAAMGDRLAAMERAGLDFRPPKGESARDVQDRLRSFLADRAHSGRDAVAVCHKGVIRALYALATGWQMQGPPPTKLRDPCWHAFRLQADGTPSVDRLNAPLAPAPDTMDQP